MDSAAFVSGAAVLVHNWSVRGVLSDVAEGAAVVAMGVGGAALSAVSPSTIGKAVAIAAPLPVAALPVINKVIAPAAGTMLVSTVVLTSGAYSSPVPAALANDVGHFAGQAIAGYIESEAPPPLIALAGAYGLSLPTVKSVPDQWGRQTGRALAAVQSLEEIFTGLPAFLGGSGVLVTSAGTTTPVSAPVAAVGALAVLHGVWVIWNIFHLPAVAVGSGSATSTVMSTSTPPPTGPTSAATTPAPPRGSANPNTAAAAGRGSTLHSDKPGNLPDQLRQRYPNTQFEFKKPGVPGQDVHVVGGTHPSEYPGSQWPEGVDYGDFKPDTPGGNKTFNADQKNKWGETTQNLPYDPQTGKLK